MKIKGEDDIPWCSICLWYFMAYSKISTKLNVHFTRLSSVTDVQYLLADVRYFDEIYADDGVECYVAY